MCVGVCERERETKELVETIPFNEVADDIGGCVCVWVCVCGGGGGGGGVWGGVCVCVCVRVCVCVCRFLVFGSCYVQQRVT